MAYRVFEYTFSPLTRVGGNDFDVLSDCFSSQSLSPSFTLNALRRKFSWATTLPLGVFVGDYRPNAVTATEHLAEHDRLMLDLPLPEPNATEVPLGDIRYHRPRRLDQHVVERDGKRFYAPQALRLLAPKVPHPAFLDALCAFLEDASRDPSMIIPKAPKPYIPPEQRKAYFGLKADMCRGPGWTEEEDAVLRRWFSCRTVGVNAGKHVKLTEQEWEAVMVELKGRRSVASIRNRMVDLNKSLFNAYAKDGYIPYDKIRLYMQNVLGERPRAPKIRPRALRKSSSHP